MWKEDVINNQLAPRLLAINNIKLDWKDMPVFKAADPSKPDLDVISKVIQRTKSVGGMTPQALEKLYKEAGWPTEGIEDLNFEDGDTSRGGESGGTSGTGNSQSGKSGGSNTNNSVTKQLIVDGDKLVDTATGEVVNTDQLTENGEYE
jgi:hypothetical protein